MYNGLSDFRESLDLPSSGRLERKKVPESFGEACLPRVPSALWLSIGGWRPVHSGIGSAVHIVIVSTHSSQQGSTDFRYCEARGGEERSEVRLGG